MTGEDDGPALRVELRPHAQSHLVGLPAKHRGINRLHEGVHAVETFGSGAGGQPFEITVRTRDVTIRASSDVDDDVSALRHELRSPPLSLRPGDPRSRGYSRRGPRRRSPSCPTESPQAA